MPSLDSDSKQQRHFFSVASFEEIMLPEFYSHKEMNSTNNSILRELGGGFFTTLQMRMQPGQHFDFSLVTPPS